MRVWGFAQGAVFVRGHTVRGKGTAQGPLQTIASTFIRYGPSHLSTHSPLSPGSFGDIISLTTGQAVWKGPWVFPP